jgi:hypothetical protein
MVGVVELEGLGVLAGRLVLEVGVAVAGSKERLAAEEIMLHQTTQIKSVGGIMHFLTLREVLLRRAS